MCCLPRSPLILAFGGVFLITAAVATRLGRSEDHPIPAPRVRAQAPAPIAGPPAVPNVAGHWAFTRPRVVLPPTVNNAAWPRCPVDAFVLRSLEAHDLAPSIPAERAALAKRLTLTLTGLPPTLDELDAFLADMGPDAAERLVDRLLAAPQYGERMAVPWLDLARYADTHGYHADAHRDMWSWRDWVVQAFNRGLPFDQFTIEQLAGDLLPNATLAQRIATGFNRNHMIIFENGVIDEEYRTEYVADRVATTATAWLGMTMSCARCHDHKHDPFTQRDYYRLFAFFNNVSERGIDGDQGNATPYLAAPTSRQRADLDRLDDAIARLHEEINHRLATPATGQDEWERRLQSGAIGAASPPDDAVLHLAFNEPDGPSTRNGVRDGGDGTIRGPVLRVPGKLGSALLFGGETTIEFEKLGDFSAQDAFSVCVWIFPTSDSPSMFVARCQDDDARRGYEIGLVDRRPTVRLTHDRTDRVLEVRGRRQVALRKWQHVTATYDGSGQAGGVKLWLDGEPLACEAIRDTLRGSIRTSAPLAIGGVAPDPFRGLLDEVRLFARALKPSEAVALAGLNPLAELLAVPAERRTPQQIESVRRAYLTENDAAFREAERRLRGYENERDVVRRAQPTVMVMQELPQPRTTRVLARGRYDQPGEVVTAGVPGWLPKCNEPSRLGLARWLVSAENPLTARVTVNRFWHLAFGQGIVRTLDDFGTHGDAPSHPELLDWLAREFSRPDRFAWDVKRLVRELVVSATFRQSNHATAAQASPSPNHVVTGVAVDPDNRLLGRGPRQRLSAEMLRDSALAVSGRLDRRLAGPSVFPYQPAGLWEELAYDTQSFTAQRYVPSVGGDLFRRSLYTFWKRASPPPAMSILDAPDREVCTALRTTTTTPQQALVLLNEPTFVEAARGLAERALQDETLRSDAQRIAWMFRAATARAVNRDEQIELERLFADQCRSFAEDPASAAAFLGVDESEREEWAEREERAQPSNGTPRSDGPRRDPLARDASRESCQFAALAVVAHVILSLDENLTSP